MQHNISESAPIRVLIVNPNTSQGMTDALRPVVQDLGHENVSIDYFTSPSAGGIPSIDSPSDAEKSAEACIESLVPLISHYDAFLIACYSRHPLVKLVQKQIDLHLANTLAGSRRKYVTGIFEASVTASLINTAAATDYVFGIVSTGRIWETALQDAVDQFSGGRSNRFIGCFTTGLNASDLHDLPKDQVQAKMKEATIKLLKARSTGEKNVKVRAICLGCAGMVGLEQSVRQACTEELGESLAKDVIIVDGVKTGVAQLIALVKCGF